MDIKMKNFLICSLSVLFACNAFADSYWNHNGSIMRLSSSGNHRIFSYEIPSNKMLKTGVSKGTMLFDGRRIGNKYAGIAKVFSEYCVNPLSYQVSGYVVNERKVVLSGTREIYAENCIATGRYTTDSLEFNYVSSN